MFSVFLTLFSYSSNAQSDNQILLAGKIINQENNEYVAFANMYINNTRMGVMAEESGMYRIRVHAGDSIRVTVMGYEDKIIKISPSVKNDSYKDIYLKPISYMLADVDVLNLGTWEEFKQDFIHMKIEKTETEKLTEKLCQSLGLAVRKDMKDNPIFPTGSGIGISLGKPYAQRVKERREAYARAEKKNRILASKYNAEIVAKIIGEKKQERIDLFMVYVNTHTFFNSETPEKEIIIAIKDLYSDFIHLFPKENTAKRDTTA
jgi:hypothetical protein